MKSRPAPDRRPLDEKNEERLALLAKRVKRELSAKEERKYQQLNRAVMRYCKNHLSADYESIKSLGRSPFTPYGQMVRNLRKRRKANNA